MKEQLISFETAKLAKEKGFNEVCKWYITSDTISDGNETNDFLRDGYYSAPTQSILQKWLREVHKLQIYVEPVWKDYHRVNTEYIPWVSYTKEEEDNHLPDEEEVYYSSYEEALEIALVEALNTIPNKQ